MNRSNRKRKVSTKSRQTGRLVAYHISQIFDSFTPPTISALNIKQIGWREPPYAHSTSTNENEMAQTVSKKKETKSKRQHKHTATIHSKSKCQHSMQTTTTWKQKLSMMNNSSTPFDFQLGCLFGGMHRIIGIHCMRVCVCLSAGVLLHLK